jgi:probable HAF family extracellular repeat protein
MRESRWGRWHRREHCLVKGSRKVRTALAVVLAFQLLALTHETSSFSAQSASLPAYDLVDLGTLGGEASYGNDIDGMGRIVGESQIYGAVGCGGLGEEAYHAFLWADGAMTDLGTLGGANSGASAISPTGDVVGWSETAVGETHATAWSPDGQIADLGTIGNLISVARSINERGQIVGTSYSADYTDTRAFLFEDNMMIDLAPLVTANAIDAAGRIIGTTEDGGAILREADGSTFNLFPLTRAIAINAEMQIVGEIETGEGSVHAAIWDEGKIIDLGALPDRPNSYPSDLNDSAQAVGVTVLGMICGYSTEAALWGNGETNVLGNLVRGGPVELIDAAAINNSGQIVATMADSGNLHAVLLTPLTDGTNLPAASPQPN